MMLNKVITLTAVAALTVLLVPSRVDAWGAAHVGATHVGPGGVYHAGRTVAAGPGGVYAGGRAVGGSGGVYGARSGAVGYDARSGAVGYGAKSGAVGYGGNAYRAAGYGYIR
jgi:hypothetical protein